MRHTLTALLTAFTIATVSTAADAAKTARTQGQTFSGTMSYIYPFYSSSAANPVQSFLRVINPESFANDIAFTVTDQLTAQTLGVCRLTIPAHGSPQYTAAQIEKCALIAAPAGSGSYRLSADMGDYMSYQHIVWSALTGYLSNVSSCRDAWIADNYFNNVHTSAIPGYPSTVGGMVETSSNFAVSMNIYNATTGQLAGTFQSTTFPVGTKFFQFRMDEIEAKGFWNAGARPAHVNLELTLRSPATGAEIPLEEIQLTTNSVFQEVRQELYNMAVSCAY